MNGFTISIVLLVAALIAALTVQQNIRRGSARFYALERETLLRRASFTLLAAIILFVGAFGLLAYDRAQLIATPEVEEEAAVEVVATATPTPLFETQPATPPPTETPDPDAPTPTPTPFIRRGIIENTAGSGVYLRERPGTDGPELEILNDGAIVTLVDEEPPVEANGFTWLKVRTIAGEEGWLVDVFITVSDR